MELTNHLRLKRILPFNDPEKKRLHDFVTTSTRQFFTLLDLPMDFLSSDPDQWSQLQSYISSQGTVGSVRVVNDLAERGVALIQQFNSLITRDEEQKQYLLQIVEKHRQTFSTANKT